MFIIDIFYCWYMDILEFIIIFENYKYVLLVVDLFSRWCEVILLKL